MVVMTVIVTAAATTMTTVLASASAPELSYHESSRFLENLQPPQQYLLKSHEGPKNHHLHYHHHHYHHHHLHHIHENNPNHQKYYHYHYARNHNQQQQRRLEPAIKSDNLANSINNSDFYDGHVRDDDGHKVLRTHYQTSSLQDQDNNKDYVKATETTIVNTHHQRQSHDAFEKNYPPQQPARDLRISSFQRNHNHCGKESLDQSDSLKSDLNQNSYHKSIKGLLHHSTQHKLTGSNNNIKPFWKLTETRKVHRNSNRNRKNYDYYSHPGLESSRVLTAQDKGSVEGDGEDHGEDEYDENDYENGYNYELDREGEDDFQYDIRNHFSDEEEGGSGFEDKHQHNGNMDNIGNREEADETPDYINDAIADDDWSHDEDTDSLAEHRHENNLSDRSYTRIIRSRLHVSKRQCIPFSPFTLAIII